jgi:3-oxoacyl-[acyl-carrier protein] reductase
VNLGLDGKVALVCGASRGIGRAVASELAAEGASVAVCSRDADRLSASAAEIGPDVLAIPADLAEPGEGTRVVQATEERFDRVDVLVANTGGPPAGTHDTLSLDDWDRATALLLRSTVELASAVLPGMKERGWGRILAVTSVAVKQPVDNLILSNSLRAAVTGYVKTLAREVAQDGITVNTILPGYTATERVTELNQANAEREGVGIEEVKARLEASIPMGRLAEPEEFAALAAFLASERAGYITGGSFAVDGGWLRGLL